MIIQWFGISKSDKKQRKERNEYFIKRPKIS